VGKAQRAHHFRGVFGPTEDRLSASITANALGGDIAKLWKRFPGALWMALETQRTRAGIHESW
jgi:hypothetical protein